MPVTLKLIVSPSLSELAWLMASRSEQAPPLVQLPAESVESAVVFTVSVVCA